MVAAVAQSTKESVQISEQESLQLTRNLLRIAIFNISYIRGLFPEKYFDDKFVPALEMKIKKLLPLDDESRRLIDWMERGVYDALSKKYLRTLVFSMCHSGEDGDGDQSRDGKLLEEYTFSFSYGDKDAEVSMDISHKDGDKKKGKSFRAANKESTPADMKASACKMVRTLVQLMRTLDTVPKERTIIMKLYYYDDITPADYEPPFFRGCEEDDHLTWSKNPLKLKVGNVDSKHYAISLKVRSVLDPCGGNGEEGQDEASNDSDAPANHDGSESSDSDSDDNSDNDMDIPEKQGGITPDVRGSGDNVATVRMASAGQDGLEKKKPPASPMQDPYSFTQEQVKKVKGPVAMEMDKGYHTRVEEDEDAQIYSKALYHTLSCEHITIGQLQSKVDVTAAIAKKLLEKMVKEGYLEPTATNRRQGRRVLHTANTDKRLKEVINSMEGCKIEPPKSHAGGTHKADTPAVSKQMAPMIPSPRTEMNSSTCGVVQSPGSDVTRYGSKMPQGDASGTFKTSGLFPRGGMKKPPSPAMKVNVNATPEGSCSSPGRKPEVLGVKRVISTPFANFQDSQETHEEGSQRARKSSVVLEPIHQGVKRIRSD